MTKSGDRESRTHLKRAVELACENARSGGQPFGAVLVRDGRVLAEAVNRCEELADPTAHAELLAVRDAGRLAGLSGLRGSIVYASGEPCAMCFAAMRIAGVTKVVFAYSGGDSAAYGMGIDWLYEEMTEPTRKSALQSCHQAVASKNGDNPFEIWKAQKS